jgi:hypothetical protein
VLLAADGAARVAVTLPGTLPDATGSIRTGALVSALHGAGLVAILAACGRLRDAAALQPVSTSATLDFRGPAAGRLVGECTLDDEGRVALACLLTGEAGRVRLRTLTEIMDSTGLVSCSGTFRWSIRRRWDGDEHRLHPR